MDDAPTNGATWPGWDPIIVIWVIWICGWVGNSYVWKRKEGAKPERENKQKDHLHMTTHIYLCLN